MSNSTEMNLIRDIVAEIAGEADSILEKHDDLFDDGQLLAYNNCLGIIKTLLTGYEDKIKEFGLDIDLDVKYSSNPVSAM